MAEDDDFDDFGDPGPGPDPTEKDYTLCFVRSSESGADRLLLGMKKRGFGVGEHCCYNARIKAIWSVKHSV